MVEPISGRVDTEFATETVDSGSIPGWVKPKTTEIGIHSFPAWRLAIKKQCEAAAVCGGQVAAWLEDWKIPSLFSWPRQLGE